MRSLRCSFYKIYKTVLIECLWVPPIYHEEADVTEIEAWSYADADFGDSSAWQEVFMSGSAGYAYANAFSDYPVDAEAHLNLPYIAGGLFGGMDAYQNGLAATTSVW